MSARSWLARRLQYAADRLDPDNAFRLMTTLTVTCERGRGWVLHTDGRGCPVWYRGHADYDRAHTEAENPL